MMPSISFPSSSAEISRMRSGILSLLCSLDSGFAETPVRSIKLSTLDAMLSAYDTTFFQGTLRRAYGTLSVTLSSRLISSAGKFVYARSRDKRMIKAEIRMSSDFLTRLSCGPYSLNGLTVRTPQEAFLIVFEHELCHALETALYGETGHSARFLSLANRFFGHTLTTHSLPTRKAQAAQCGICVGALCSFYYKERLFSGRITYVGKTVTVMVQSSTGEYRDRCGRRYTKYRVPPEQILLR